VGLLVVGINHKSSQVKVREKFWLSEAQRYEALRQLTQVPGVREAVILATCNRTEFIHWADGADLAIQAARDYLRKEFGLVEAEWNCFYRVQNDEALEDLSSRTVGRIAALLGRELRDRAEAPEIERMMVAVHRLFRLPQPSAGAQGEV
jgi:glutamyl-tRNA reductase